MPPRARDLPSHLAFCKKWGGGQDQSFVFDICDYVKMNDRTNIVGGHIFDAICRLQFGVNDMCPEFIAAVVKCASTRGANRNGVSAHITEQDVKSIPKRIELIRDANAKMLKAKEVIVNNGLGECKRARGNMECDMVDYVFEKMSKDDRKATSLDCIADNFLKEVCGIGAHDEQPSSSIVENAKSNAEDVFNPSENIAEQTMANLGWKPGVLLKQKEKKNADNDSIDFRVAKQFEIAYINSDGDVGLYPLACDGKPLVENVFLVNALQLNSSYKAIEAANRLEVDKSYDPKRNYGLDVQLFQSGLLMALTAALHNENKVPCDAFYVQKKPVERLVAKKTLTNADVVLVPYTNNVKLQEEGYGVCATMTHGDKKFTFSLDKPTTKDCQKGCELEFWRIRKVSDKNQSNMIITTIDINVTLPKIGKYPKTIVYTLPVARITNNVNEFDELVLYVPAKEKICTKRKSMVVVSTPMNIGNKKAK